MRFENVDVPLDVGTLDFPCELFCKCVQRRPVWWRVRGWGEESPTKVLEKGRGGVCSSTSSDSSFLVLREHAHGMIRERTLHAFYPFHYYCSGCSKLEFVGELVPFRLGLQDSK